MHTRLEQFKFQQLELKFEQFEFGGVQVKIVRPEKISGRPEVSRERRDTRGAFSNCGFQMDDVEHNLNRYLAAEQRLNAFFGALDYCLPQCIAVERLKNGNQPVAACCQNKYYAICDLPHPAFERLRQERERRFGRPEAHVWANPVSPCQYHNPDHGCVLVTHKSPICLAFLCREGIDHLRSRYGIYAYDYLGFHYALEWTLTGDLPDKDYAEFMASIADMTARVRQTDGAAL